jgi:DNA-binding transcriptional LysR family regulator
MNYTLNQLRIFVKIVDKESITKASEELFLTQPAVSIQLKKFQDQFDIPLTEVIGRKLYVTDFGHEIAKACEKILSEVEVINYKALSHQNLLGGNLKIASVSTGKYVAPFFLTDFMRKHKGVDLFLDTSNRQEALSKLESNSVDFALVSVLPKKMNIKGLSLLRNKLYFVGKKGLRTNNQSVKETLEDYPILLREEGSATRTETEKYLETHSIKTTRKVILESNEALKQALIAGIGYSIMPLIGLKSQLELGELEIIPVDGLPVETEWNLIWLKEKSLSPVASEFVKYLQEKKDEITKDHFDWIEKY